ncbi:unnamed protein product [Bemisia tabaci]|uniref:Laminin subunit alpha n=1 Tax=Bemisia tabaci TaxID=7038 RepID=A0A9P0EZU2_BEMTA|nr:unnamed protein product [Bemisia tabaci]
MGHARVLDWAAALVLAVLAPACVICVVLTPPYFNLAANRRVTASATCGVGTPGPELYCKLVGAVPLVDVQKDPFSNSHLVNGQVCDYCDPNVPEQAHPPENAVDGQSSWWQSPPLSRGMKYNEINLTIDLGQEFHVAYVLIKMGNSPRPGVWVLERSADNGKTYQPWQYFADTKADCLTYFGPESLKPIERDDSVICETAYSTVLPLEDGEIVVSLLNKRPSASEFFNSTVLQEYTRATNVRLRLLRTKTLLGHLMSVSRQDPTVTRRYFYSIKDISIGGRCRCNGHADTCDITDPEDSYKLICRCQHNTCGHNCEYCCPGFEQKAWSQSKSNISYFECEPCNCFGHSEQCVYNATVDEMKLSLDIHGKLEGGGVCQNCRDNTEGINCNKCKAGFYRPYNKQWNETDVCQPCQCGYFYATGNCAEGSGQCECRKEFQPPNCDSCSFGHYDYPNCKPCDCHPNGTVDSHCEATGGQCPCKSNYAGKFCDKCAEGFYNFPECLPCGCNVAGAQTDICDPETGNCPCVSSFGGRTCDQCNNGYYGFPGCTFCSCDQKGTVPEICEKNSGKCLCAEGYEGDRCDRCKVGYYGFPNCKPCNCSQIGSVSIGCDGTGKCSCLTNFAGQTCEMCTAGYHKYPECLPCNCDPDGSNGNSCDNNGQCFCNPNFEGIQCGKCKEGLYNFPLCEECNCNPAGIKESFAGCGTLPAGSLCECKPRVQGRICNECRELFWNLQPGNPLGCEDCDCYIPGTLGGIGSCDTKTGQCVCKPSVTSRRCDICADGHYNLQEDNLFGCTDCGCDIGGSVSTICNKQTGQCQCQPRVTGRTCREPLQAHYFPSLHQYQFEAEDARTPNLVPLRYDFNSTVFPGFSWRGYAIFSPIQDTIISQLTIEKPSVYHMILRYVNPLEETVTANIAITPEFFSNIATEQNFKVLLKPSRTPTFMTVSGPSESIPAPFVMDPGYWSVTIKSPKIFFLDYFVLLPAEFYEADILVDKVVYPCVSGNETICRHFRYLDDNTFDVVKTDNGFTSPDGQSREPIRFFFTETEGVENMENKPIPAINKEQPELRVDLRVQRPGPHVLLLNYGTPQNNTEKPSKVLIEASSQNKQYRGIAFLNQCRYSTLCRQVVVDKNHTVAVFDFDTNFINVVLKTEEPETTVGVESVTAIPYDKWSLDYILPKPACVRKDGKCIPSSFRNPPESVKVEFEAGAPEQVAKELPTGIYDNQTGLIFLNHADPMIDVRAKVPNPSYYSFVVHYYQPDHPQFDMDVIIQNGQFYEAKLLAPHCPASSGCRSVVKQANGNTQFALTENVVLTLKEPDHKSIWLDYVLIVPVRDFTDDIIQEEPVDLAGLFISQCGQNNFFMSSDTSGFCREAAFSVVTNYNSAALPCQCNIEGSLNFECSQFGGQCKCRPNVIGRRCELCETGYYGFPNCKPCDCPAKLCEQNTGACLCPQNVIGEKCTECKEYTYGFDLLVGCTDCACNEQGVKNGNLQCDLLNGTCDCKDHVVGRACDHCMDGNWAFPHCVACQCDLRGTIPEICNQNNAECFCKLNVEGPACDICKEGTFNIQAKNNDGCTKCFCFGKTTRCTSSNLYRTTIQGMDGWKLVSLNVSKTVNVESIGTLPQKIESGQGQAIGVDLTALEDKIIYFQAPEKFLGNKLTSHGGDLNFTLLYTNGLFGNAISQADIVLYGAGIYLLHFSFRQPAASIPFDASVSLVETNFVVPSGIQATREQLMQVLQDLQAIYIRATFWEQSVTTRLQDVSLDSATDTYFPDATFALDVEQCQCPSNYQGLSCEECADGYYRSSHSSFKDVCIPCQCNGHATTCDKSTGICIDCRHNTVGDHCEKCAIGYHGNATTGTPNDCLICACPLPIESNNFATGCEVTDDGERISCQCIPGYFGARCESCSAGYYGNPEHEGDFCKPCSCSGNINPSDPSSCDSITGECTHCLNNTFGTACQYCAPGYFGDAVNLKDCQSCACDKCGTEKCDDKTGICQCMTNVIGEKCDRCADKHYGFSTCHGCRACDCQLASESLQCDDHTGQCKCKPGVTGRTCDRCISGYWDYSASGCVSCGCNSEFSVGVGCNPKTGQCECLHGVIGEKCDHCPHRWVLIPDDGCYECDTCTWALLDTTDSLSNQLAPILDEFKTVAKGYFTTQRLVYLNETVEKLRSNVSQNSIKSIDIAPMTKSIENLEFETRNLHRKSELIIEKGIEEVNKSGILLSKTNDVETLMKKAIDDSRIIVFDVKTLASNLADSTGPQIDIAMGEAKSILDRIQRNEMDEETIDSVNESDTKAKEIHKQMMEFREPVDGNAELLTHLRERIEFFNEKLDDLKKHRDVTKSKIQETQVLNDLNRSARLKGKTDILKNLTIEASSTLENVKELIENATSYNNRANKAISDLSIGLPARKTLNAQLNESVENLRRELLEARNKVRDADAHAHQLMEQAENLDLLFVDTRSLSDNAYSAATAYQKIISKVNDSFNIARDAKIAAEKAEQMLTGLNDRSSLSDNSSTVLLGEAKSLLFQAQSELAPQLNMAEEKCKRVVLLNKNITAGFNDIDQAMSRIPSTSPENNLDSIIPKANVGEIAAANVLESLNPISAELSEWSNATKQLGKDIVDTNISVSQANNQLDSFAAALLNVSSLMEKLKARPQELDGRSNQLKMSMDQLKSKIALARDLANKIKVGVSLYDNSTLELRNPENLAQQGISTDISLYFKTDKRNGLILFVGNEAGSRMKRQTSDDYLMLQVENGYPKLTVNLGSDEGPGVLQVNKYVADDTWYKAVIERTGTTARLKIIDDQGDVQKEEAVVKGSRAVLNLDKDTSHIFVGSLPESFKGPESVPVIPFYGQIQDLSIGRTPIGLWNFVDGDHIGGSRDRDQLVHEMVSTGYRLNGDGYVTLDGKDYKLQGQSEISFKFKTKQKEGLLFLAAKDYSYLSVELRDGKVLFQYNLGSGAAQILSPKTYNDDQYHSVEAVRQGRDGVLKVDGVPIEQKTAQGELQELYVSDRLYVGGFPGEHKLPDISNTGFDGCIDNVQINSISVDLNKNINAHDVVPGCPDKFVSTVSFNSGSHGYVKLSGVSAMDNTFQLILRLNTTYPNGLILFATDGTENLISLRMENGILIFKTGQSELKSSQLRPYDDGQWHVVFASHNSTDNSLQLVIDDFDVFNQTDITRRAEPIRLVNGNIFFGAVPSTIDASTIGTTYPFSGCISDVTINGEIVNFAKAKANNVIVGKCMHGEGSHLRPPPKPVKSEDEEDFDFSPTSPSTPAVLPSVAPTPAGLCVLPISPLNDPNVTAESGQRFGTTRGSRVEYLLASKLKSKFDISIQFKTISQFGTILYAANELHAEYVAVYLVDGKVHFGFSSGGQAGLLQSTEAYNDGEWHELSFKRVGLVGELLIDDKSVAAGQAGGNKSSISLIDPVYIGGLNPELIEKLDPKLQEQVMRNIGISQENIENAPIFFEGCLRNLRKDSRPIKSAKNPSTSFGVIPCSDRVERGTYFSMEGGYVKLADKLKVPNEFDVKLDFKARNISGFMLGVFSKHKDFLSLQMIDGKIKFSVENGNGVISASFEPPEKHFFCNGEWHSLQAVKAKNVVSLSVNKVFVEPGIGIGGAWRTDVNNPLYVGGHPEIEKLYGQHRLDTAQNFIGCIRDIEINSNGKPEDFPITVDKAYGNVTVGICSTI